jgi:hypothetical protein
MGDCTMTEWVYKSRRARATYADAHDLAVTDHFLCFSAFAHTLGPARVREVENVGEIAVGDLIYYYYRTPEGRVRSFGSFRVCDGSAYPSVFTPCPDHGALVRVNEAPENRRMVSRLIRGYSHDPKFAAFTGFVLEKLPAVARTPGFNQEQMFPTLTTNLWRFPDASLPRAKSA